MLRQQKKLFVNIRPHIQLLRYVLSYVLHVKRTWHTLQFSVQSIFELMVHRNFIPIPHDKCFGRCAHPMIFLILMLTQVVNILSLRFSDAYVAKMHHLPVFINFCLSFAFYPASAAKCLRPTCPKQQISRRNPMFTFCHHVTKI